MAYPDQHGLQLYALYSFAKDPLSHGPVTSLRNPILSTASSLQAWFCFVTREKATKGWISGLLLPLDIKLSELDETTRERTQGDGKIVIESRSVKREGANESVRFQNPPPPCSLRTNQRNVSQTYHSTRHQNLPPISSFTVYLYIRTAQGVWADMVKDRKRKDVLYTSEKKAGRGREVIRRIGIIAGIEDTRSQALIPNVLYIGSRITE
ncbi:hypothetical protein D9758_018261 [Tetrapyrgos nigripes]|uniref:Uncharacterized protein n=1 Tax=Tetrapyrgos nigripes TaxID=182062 RepID=A0A8H5FC88_9AGAR|nr:hypothetical protein D9758_018261 [Tetrapyrgos nigripes]